MIRNCRIRATADGRGAEAMIRTGADEHQDVAAKQVMIAQPQNNRRKLRGRPHDQKPLRASSESVREAKVFIRVTATSRQVEASIRDERHKTRRLKGHDGAATEQRPSAEEEAGSGQRAREG